MIDYIDLAERIDELTRLQGDESEEFLKLNIQVTEEFILVNFEHSIEVVEKAKEKLEVWKLKLESLQKGKSPPAEITPIPLTLLSSNEKTKRDEPDITLSSITLSSCMSIEAIDIHRVPFPHSHDTPIEDYGDLHKRLVDALAKCFAQAVIKGTLNTDHFPLLSERACLSNSFVLEYLTLLKEKYKKCVFVDTFVWESAVKSYPEATAGSLNRYLHNLDVEKVEQIFFSILSGNHFILMIAHKSDEKLYIMDSMTSSDEWYQKLAHSTVFILQDYFKLDGQWKVFRVHHDSIQKGGSSCGVFMLKFAQSWAMGSLLKITNEAQVECFRISIFLEIWKKALASPFDLGDFIDNLDFTEDSNGTPPKQTGEPPEKPRGEERSENPPAKPEQKRRGKNHTANPTQVTSADSGETPPKQTGEPPKKPRGDEKSENPPAKPQPKQRVKNPTAIPTQLRRGSRNREPVKKRKSEVYLEDRIYPKSASEKPNNNKKKKRGRKTKRDDEAHLDKQAGNRRKK